MAAFPDPRPQASIRTVSGTNSTPQIGPYTDPGITVDNPPVETIVPTPATTKEVTGNIRPFYTTDREPEIDSGVGLPETAAPAKASNSWQPGHDMYTNNGNVTGPTTVGVPPPTPAPFGGTRVYT